MLEEGPNKAADEPRSLREARQPVQRGPRGPRTELSLPCPVRRGGCRAGVMVALLVPC